MAWADRMRKSIGRWPVIATLAAVGLVGFWQIGKALEGPPLDGEMAGWILETKPPLIPDFTLKTPDNTPLGPSDFAGRLILMNFWATWCVPCAVEMPSFDRLQAAYKDMPMEIVAISIDQGGADIVRGFYEQKGIENLVAYLDPDGWAADAFDVDGIPTSILISPEGRILGRYEGMAQWDKPEVYRLLDHFLAATT